MQIKMSEVYKKETGKSPMFFSGIGEKLYNNAYIEWLEERAALQPCESVECDVISIDFEDDLLQVKVPRDVTEEGFHAGSVLIDFSGVQ